MSGMLQKVVKRSGAAGIFAAAKRGKQNSSGEQNSSGGGNTWSGSISGAYKEAQDNDKNWMNNQNSGAVGGANPVNAQDTLADKFDSQYGGGGPQTKGPGQLASKQRRNRFKSGVIKKT